MEKVPELNVLSVVNVAPLWRFTEPPGLMTGPLMRAEVPCRFRVKALLDHTRPSIQPLLFKVPSAPSLSIAKAPAPPAPPRIRPLLLNVGMMPRWLIWTAEAFPSSSPVLFKVVTSPCRTSPIFPSMVPAFRSSVMVPVFQTPQPSA